MEKSINRNRNCSSKNESREKFCDLVNNNKLKDLSELEIVKYLFLYLFGKPKNELAERLIEKYGTLYNICNTPLEELTDFDGISRNVAQFLVIFPEIVERCCEDNVTTNPNNINLNNLLPYLAEISNPIKEECFIIKLKDEFNVDGYFSITSNEEHYVNLTPRQITENLLRDGSKMVALAHNHPSGSTRASINDRVVTKEVQKLLKLMEIKIENHFILTKNQASSVMSGEDMYFKLLKEYESEQDLIDFE